MAGKIGTESEDFKWISTGGGEGKDDIAEVVSGFWVKVDVGCGFSREVEREG